MPPGAEVGSTPVILDKPTTGMIHKKTLYYIVNSPRNHCEEPHEPRPESWPDMQGFGYSVEKGDTHEDKYLP